MPSLFFSYDGTHHRERVRSRSVNTRSTWTIRAANDAEHHRFRQETHLRNNHAQVRAMQNRSQSQTRRHAKHLKEDKCWRNRRKNAGHIRDSFNEDFVARARASQERRDAALDRRASRRAELLGICGGGGPYSTASVSHAVNFTAPGEQRL